MRDVHRHLSRALVAKLPGLELVEGGSTPWASITFSGERHLFRFAGPGPAPDLAEAEFQLPGHIVADIACRSEAGQIAIEVLTIAAD